MPFLDVFDTLRLLTPYDVEGRKVRIGSLNDGGYVMLDRFSPNQIVFSYGLSWNIAFEHDLAKRGHQIFMFDHTIDRLTLEDRHFNWLKEGIAASSSPPDLLYSLPDHLARLAPDATDMILKLDVEGSEWSVIERLPLDVLMRFEQIVVEMHDFRLITDVNWRTCAKAALSRLTQNFTIHHVHANNHGPLVVIENTLPVADVIEVSFIRSDLVKRSPLSAFLPAHFDAPNDPTRPEIPLWFFPFAPTGNTGSEAAVETALGGAAARFAEMLQSTPATT